MTERAKGHHIARVERYRATKRRFRSVPVPVEQPLYVAGRELRLWQFGVRTYGVRGRLARARRDFARISITVDRARGIGVRQPGPCQGVVRIQRYGLLVELNRARHGFAIALVLKITSVQVRVVRRGVRRLSTIEPDQTCRRNFDAD